MCLTVDKKHMKILTTKRDMVVYKVLEVTTNNGKDTLSSLYMGTKYYFDKMMHAKRFNVSERKILNKKLYDKDNMYLGYGLHSFKTEKDARFIARLHSADTPYGVYVYAYKSIITKGTKYIAGTFLNIPSIMSEFLIVKKFP